MLKLAVLVILFSAVVADSATYASLGPVHTSLFNDAPQIVEAHVNVWDAPPKRATPSDPNPMFRTAVTGGTAYSAIIDPDCVRYDAEHTCVRAGLWNMVVRGIQASGCAVTYCKTDWLSATGPHSETGVPQVDAFFNTDATGGLANCPYGIFSSQGELYALRRQTHYITQHKCITLGRGNATRTEGGTLLVSPQIAGFPDNLGVQIHAYNARKPEEKKPAVEFGAEGVEIVGNTTFVEPYTSRVGKSDTPPPLPPKPSNLAQVCKIGYARLTMALDGAYRFAGEYEPLPIRVGSLRSTHPKVLSHSASGFYYRYAVAHTAEPGPYSVTYEFGFTAASGSVKVQMSIFGLRDGMLPPDADVTDMRKFVYSEVEHVLDGADPASNTVSFTFTLLEPGMTLMFVGRVLDPGNVRVIPGAETTVDLSLLTAFVTCQ